MSEIVEFQTNREKELRFTLSTKDVEDRDLKAFFRIYLPDNVNVGFSGRIDENKARIVIPPLDSILRQCNPGTYSARLEVVGSKSHFDAWTGDVRLKGPGEIVARLDEVKIPTRFAKPDPMPQIKPMPPHLKLSKKGISAILEAVTIETKTVPKPDEVPDDELTGVNFDGL